MIFEHQIQKKGEMSRNENDPASIGKAIVTSEQPERQTSEWRAFEQLFLATIRDIGIRDVLTRSITI